MASVRISSCAICTENTVDKDPLAAPCGHVFCKECIENWMGDKTDVQCPLCRLPFKKSNLLALYMSSEPQELAGSIRMHSSISVPLKQIEVSYQAMAKERISLVNRIQSLEEQLEALRFDMSQFNSCTMSPVGTPGHDDIYVDTPPAVRCASLSLRTHTHDVGVIITEKCPPPELKSEEIEDCNRGALMLYEFSVAFSPDTGENQSELKRAGVVGLPFTPRSVASNAARTPASEGILAIGSTDSRVVIMSGISNAYLGEGTYRSTELNLHHSRLVDSGKELIPIHALELLGCNTSRAPFFSPSVVAASLGGVSLISLGGTYGGDASIIGHIRTHSIPLCISSFCVGHTNGTIQLVDWRTPCVYKWRDDANVIKIGDGPVRQMCEGAGFPWSTTLFCALERSIVALDMRFPTKPLYVKSVENLTNIATSWACYNQRSAVENVLWSYGSSLRSVESMVALNNTSTSRITRWAETKNSPWFENVLGSGQTYTTKARIGQNFHCRDKITGLSSSNDGVFVTFASGGMSLVLGV